VSGNSCFPVWLLWLDKTSDKSKKERRYEIKAEKTEIYRNSRKTNGSTRIHQKLVREDYPIGKKRVEDECKNEVFVLLPKRNTEPPPIPGLPSRWHHLNREFTPDKLNSSWVADITYILTLRRLALSGYHYGSLFPENHRLVPKEAD